MLILRACRSGTALEGEREKVISQLAARKLVLSQVEIELANLHRHVAQGEFEGQFRQLQLRAADLAAFIAPGESRKLQLDAKDSALRAKVE